MQFSKWHALGNSYLVVEQPDAGPLTPERVPVQGIWVLAEVLICPVVMGLMMLSMMRGRKNEDVGSENELRPLWNALNILSSLDSGRDSLHSAPLRIYSRDGVWVATLHAGADLSVENLLHDIRVALRPEQPN